MSNIYIVHKKKDYVEIKHKVFHTEYLF